MPLNRIEKDEFCKVLNVIQDSLKTNQFPDFCELLKTLKSERVGDCLLNMINEAFNFDQPYPGIYKIQCDNCKAIIYVTGKTYINPDNSSCCNDPDYWIIK